jgi:hypothetical protein
MNNANPYEHLEVAATAADKFFALLEAKGLKKAA